MDLFILIDTCYRDQKMILKAICSHLNGFEKKNHKKSTRVNWGTKKLKQKTVKSRFFGSPRGLSVYFLC